MPLILHCSIPQNSKNGFYIKQLFYYSSNYGCQQIINFFVPLAVIRHGLVMYQKNTFLLNKARKFCSYQERCIFDVKQKLIEWKASEKTIESIIRQLEEEDLINEERFAVSFAVGKLRNNKWGRNKIFYALMQRHIPELYVQMGLAEIDNEEYIDILRKILSTKKINETNDFRRNQKLVKHVMQKGFQSDLAWKILRNKI